MKFSSQRREEEAAATKPAAAEQRSSSICSVYCTLKLRLHRIVVYVHRLSTAAAIKSCAEKQQKHNKSTSHWMLRLDDEAPVFFYVNSQMHQWTRTGTHSVPRGQLHWMQCISAYAHPVFIYNYLPDRKITKTVILILRPVALLVARNREPTNHRAVSSDWGVSRLCAEIGSSARTSSHIQLGATTVAQHV